MARLPIPGSDQGSWGDILNDYLSQAHQADGALKTGVVTATSIADGTITEAKLDSAAQTKLNNVGSGAVSSVNGRTGAVTLTSNDVGLANVDDTSDTNKPVSAATQTALDGKSDTGHTHVIANVTGLQTALDGKAAGTHGHAIGDVTGLQTALDGKVDDGSFTLDNLSDVTAAGATDGQSLVFTGGTWGPGDVGTGSTVIDATTTAKGIVQLAGDLGGTAASPTVPGLAGKANTSTTITGTTSLTGGGSLAANRTISLVGDSASPGNSYYYGTNGSGTKGFYVLPSGGDPTLGGDLTGTASNAQIAAGAVGATELASNAVTTAKITDANVTTAKIADANVSTAKIANDAITEPKLAASNSPSTNQVLSWNGSALTWATPASADPSVGGDLTGTASNAQIASGAVGATEIAANAVTTAKILDANVTTAKIADANVTSAKIAANAVTTSAILDANVTAAKLGSNAVTTAKVIDDAITEPKLAASNTPSTNQVLSWNGSALTWATPGSGSVWTHVHRTTTATAASGEFITVDASSAGFTLTLPAASAGAYVYVKKTDSSVNGVIVQPQSGQIDGTATVVVNQQWEGEYLISNGTNWFRA